MTCKRESNCELLADCRDPELIGTNRSEKEYARVIQDVFAERAEICRVCRWSWKSKQNLRRLK